MIAAELIRYGSVIQRAVLTDVRVIRAGDSSTVAAARQERWIIREAAVANLKLARRRKHAAGKAATGAAHVVTKHALALVSDVAPPAEVLQVLARVLALAALRRQASQVADATNTANSTHQTCDDTAICARESRDALERRRRHTRRGLLLNKESRAA